MPIRVERRECSVDRDKSKMCFDEMIFLQDCLENWIVVEVMYIYVYSYIGCANFSVASPHVLRISRLVCFDHFPRSFFVKPASINQQHCLKWDKLRLEQG